MKVNVACSAVSLFLLACGAGRTPLDPGLLGSGGASGSGARVGTGGGGSGGFGLGGISRGTGSTVTFVDGRAEGAMTGYGWLAMGSLETITSPSCAGLPAWADSCSDYGWSTRTQLCLSGHVAEVSDPDNTADWGILLGVDSTNPKGGGLGQSFRAMSINFTGTPETGILAAAHRLGDPATVKYCAPLRRGSSVSFTAFKSSCHDGLGSALAQSDVPNLDWIGVEIPSTREDIHVKDLCLTSIVFE